MGLPGNREYIVEARWIALGLAALAMGCSESSGGCETYVVCKSFDLTAWCVSTGTCSTHGLADPKTTQGLSLFGMAGDQSITVPFAEHRDKLAAMPVLRITVYKGQGVPPPDGKQILFDSVPVTCPLQILGALVWECEVPKTVTSVEFRYQGKAYPLVDTFFVGIALHERDGACTGSNWACPE